MNKIQTNNDASRDAGRKFTAVESLLLMTDAGIDLNELMYYIPDSEFAIGGTFDKICRRAGYASGKSAANDLYLWGATVKDAVETIAFTA